MSRPELAPAAVWIVIVSLGGTRAPLGSVAVAVPARSLQLAKSTAELLAFWSVIVTSDGVTWPPVMRSGDAAVSVAAAGEAPVTTVAAIGDAATATVAAAGEAPTTTVAATGEAPATTVAAAGDAAVTTVAAAGDAPVTAVATAGEAVVAAAPTVGGVGAVAALQALDIRSPARAMAAPTGRIDRFTVIASNPWCTVRQSPTPVAPYASTVPPGCRRADLMGPG